MKYLGQLFLEIESLLNRTRYALFLIVLLCVLVYSRTLAVPFYFDDFSYILHNPFIEKPGDIFNRELLASAQVYDDVKNSVLARPLSYLTFSGNFLLNGTSSAGYHLVNIGIHALNACLIYLLVLITAALMRGDKGDKEPAGKAIVQERLLAFFAAALFAVHPLMTNAVTYITQRMTALATLFYLAAVVMYACSQRGGRKSLGWYLPALVFAVAAMKAKEIAATLPLMLALYDFSFLKGRLWQRTRRLLPFFALIAVCILLAPDQFAGSPPPGGDGKPSTLYVIHTLKAAPLDYLTTRFATNPASTSVATMTPLEYLFTQFRVLATYQRLLLLPVGLNFAHDYPFYRSLTDSPVLLSLLWHFLLLGSACMVFRVALRATGMAALLLRSFAFGIFWFYSALAMECSIIPMDDLMLEHRTYLPAFGLLLASVSLAMLIAGRLGQQRLACLAGVAVITLFAILTLHRNEQWRDPLVFWQDALVKSPHKHRIHGYIGNVYRDRGDMKSALREYRLMLADDFRYEQDHLELGKMLLENGLYQEALEVILSALKHWPENKSFYTLLAELYRLRGDMNLALEIEKKAESIKVPARGIKMPVLRESR